MVGRMSELEVTSQHPHNRYIQNMSGVMMASKSQGGVAGQNLKSSISKVLGSELPLLPGESAEEYQAALSATVLELGAQTPMQVYLAEKIFECIWWIRRYETQKRDSIVRAMAAYLKPRGSIDNSREEGHLVEVLRAGQLEDITLMRSLTAKSLSFESLRQAAFASAANNLARLDEGISIQLKLLSGFQRSFEHLVNRKLHVERLQLQNQILHRDLSALDVPVVIDKSANANDQSKEAPSK